MPLKAGICISSHKYKSEQSITVNFCFRYTVISLIHSGCVQNSVHIGIPVLFPIILMISFVVINWDTKNSKLIQTKEINALLWIRSARSNESITKGNISLNQSLPECTVLLLFFFCCFSFYVNLICSYNGSYQNYLRQSQFGMKVNDFSQS